MLASFVSCALEGSSHLAECHQCLSVHCGRLLFCCACLNLKSGAVSGAQQLTSASLSIDAAGTVCFAETLCCWKQVRVQSRGASLFGVRGFQISGAGSWGSERDWPDWSACASESRCRWKRAKVKQTGFLARVFRSYTACTVGHAVQPQACNQLCTVPSIFCTGIHLSTSHCL